MKKDLDLTQAQRALEICHRFKKRIPKLESLIASQEDTAYIYAMDIIGGSFPEGEPIILENHDLAVEYAFYVLDEPFEKAHPILFDQNSKVSEGHLLDYLKFLIEKNYHSQETKEIINKYAEKLI